MDDGGSASRSDATLARPLWRSPGRVPGPMKPRPPALEIATARAGLEIKRMGAPTMSGTELHGCAFCSSCAARRPEMEVIGIEEAIPRLILVSSASQDILGDETVKSKGRWTGKGRVWS